MVVIFGAIVLCFCWGNSNQQMEFVQPGERELPTIAYFLLCKESAKAINVVASPAYSTQLKDPQGQGAG